MTKTDSRRDFIKHVSTGVATATIVAGEASGREKATTINVGLIGCGGRGPDVAEKMAKVRGVSITHVCDPHQKRLAATAKQLSIDEGRVVADMRRVLMTNRSMQYSLPRPITGTPNPITIRLKLTPINDTEFGEVVIR